MRRQRHLYEVKHAVFLEQARQQIANRKDAELLAGIAEVASRKARAFAAFLGQADAWAALDRSHIVTSTECTEPASLSHAILSDGETKDTCAGK